MTHFTTAKLLSLRDSLSAHPDQDVLRSYFKGSSSGPLSSAVLVTLHRNWTTHPPYRLLSLGITTYTRTDAHNTPPPSPGPHAENLLRELWCLHLVIRPTAHIDSNTATGPPPFHFGTTIYVSLTEALDMLYAIWHQPIDEYNPKAGFRPILYMSFGNNDSVGKIRRPAFDFDPSGIDTTVATLDAQIIPQQAKITRHADASLTYLLSQFNLKGSDEDNAGNSAVYTTTVAVLSSLRMELYASTKNLVAKPGQTGVSSVKKASEVVQGLMDGPTPPPPWGTDVFCVRCGSWEHGFKGCEWEGVAACEKCEKSRVQWRRENAGTHLGDVCGFR
ncbi:hypothetical protein CFE70_009464 [Pyrenophora teres f. teres 0-1]|uniref:Gfd2/YDR514C-like C-terminal domain-containing protein n=1 Tax=Pyrenophora teres f. teres (strain 0-1) TaxID=861557 RepID=E3RL33_PYRTT|nr:hypothetical protein PTT_09034 [Pyrenophora teres f. teres 0-1]KAE8824054.1 hypothetical protein HRS9139_09236 [Pyrenophora teres f. teres]KAE8827259.1 hypothetical protein PTNB85_08612 [Pyrenophora teres f. teres]KAE8831445.1 hypothetical protein HRS9122_09035 [Pyrenophora teres f. teres]KAE8855111.1 hypothetical protein PTNB29_09362 [Pyrenophora teres f. teres]